MVLSPMQKAKAEGLGVREEGGRDEPAEGWEEDDGSPMCVKVGEVSAAAISNWVSRFLSELLS